MQALGGNFKEVSYVLGDAEVLMIWSRLILKQPGSHAQANVARVPERQHRQRRYTSFTFLSGRLRIGLPVAAKMALSTAGATTQIVGSPTPPQKS
jgi:hypothetical protein